MHYSRMPPRDPAQHIRLLYLSRQPESARKYVNRSWTRTYPKRKIASYQVVFMLYIYVKHLC